jgi:hypothetical protein
LIDQGLSQTTAVTSQELPEIWIVHVTMSMAVHV